MDSSGRPVVRGTPRDDVIVARGRDVRVLGRGGSDLICTGAGTDVVRGGPGDDEIKAGNGSDRISGGSGNDTISGGTGGEKITAGDGNDVVLGDEGRDEVFGDEGQDALLGGRGPDQMEGGPGDGDVVRGQRDNDNLHGGTGGDKIDGGLGDDLVQGDDGDDYVRGGLGTDTLDGGAGERDSLRGDMGNDTLDGGPGAHDIASYVTATPAGFGFERIDGVAINLAKGYAYGDEFDGLSGLEDVVGSPFKDEISGNGASIVDAGSGSDTCEGFAPGAATSCNDTPDPCATTCVELTTRIDAAAVLVIKGTPGPDLIRVSYANGAFRVESAGAAPLAGCAADGASVACPADPGIDTILVYADAGDDDISIDPGVRDDVQARIDDGTGDDSVAGGTGDDLLDARLGGRDVVHGGVGSDGLMSGPATDTLFGEDGADLLVASSPCDGSTLIGGDDEDNASFAEAKGYNVTARLSDVGYDSGRAGCVPTVLDRSNESLEGSPGNDVLSGDGRNNRVIGQAGDDLLKGMGGDDLVSGYAGADSLFGGAGVDTLRARDGSPDTTLDCGPGKRRESAERDDIDPRAVRCEPSK